MNQFEIRPSISIPYFDHKNRFRATIVSSARRRGRNPLVFFFRKLVNFLLFRVAYFCPLNNVRIKCHKWRGVNIGRNVYIGMQCSIDNAYPEYVYIEDDVSIAAESLVIAHSNPYIHFQDVTPAHVSPVIIKRGVWIGIRSIILPGVTIGENSIVSAGTLVNQNVLPRCVISGNPGKIIATDLPVY